MSTTSPVQASVAQAHDDGALDRQFARANPRVLDRIEQVLIAVLWVALLYRVAGSLNGYAPLVLISETAVMIFVLIRRPTTNISLRLGDWLLAITATAAPLMIQPGLDMFPAIAPLGVALVLFGNVVQGLAKLSLRRSFGIAPANRGIKADVCGLSGGAHRCDDPDAQSGESGDLCHRLVGADPPPEGRGGTALARPCLCRLQGKGALPFGAGGFLTA